VQAVFLGRAIFSVVMNPRKPTFNVTAKGQTVDKEHLSALALPYFVIFGALSAAAIWASWRYFSEPAGNDLLLICGAWNLLNLTIAGVALGVVSERPERRRAQRLGIMRRGMLEIVGGSSVAVTIDDVSTGGIRLRMLDDAFPKMRPGATIAMLRLNLEGGGETNEAIALVLRRAGHDDHGPFFGMEFIQLTPPQYKLIASLLYQDWSVFERFRSGRRQAKNVLVGSLRFLLWSFLYSLRATRLALVRKKAEAAPAPAAAEEAAAAIPQPSMATQTTATIAPAAKPETLGAPVPITAVFGSVPKFA
jgi:cellulose synthase (UDP-forming)